MDYIPFAGLVAGRFVERLNRFVALVDLDDGSGTVPVHVPTTGRMRELFVAGAPVRLMRHAAAHRKTHFDLTLVATGPASGGEEGVWVCADTRMPGRLLDRYWRVHPGPGGTAADHLAREPAWGSGRFDFALTENGRVRMVEIKSVTLVRDGLGLFPDAPTARGARHLAELAQYVEAGLGPASAVFVVQRPDATAVEANGETDPLFARALSDAARRGVGVRAYRCEVEPEGVRIGGFLPVRV